jgi:periplasmic glucans biosynthesis protein
MSALLCRRSFTRGVFLVAGSDLLLPAAAQKAARGSSRPQNTQFGFDDVVERARNLSAIPFQGDGRRLPSELDRLDYDTYREIRFRSEKALFREVDGTFQMQLFHAGFIFKRPITINVIRDGVACRFRKLRPLDSRSAANQSMIVA